MPSPPRVARRSDEGVLDQAKAHLGRADPVLAHLIAEQPDFDPRAWLAELPSMDAFGALVFQVIGQQLSVAATRRILDRLLESFDGRMPAPAQLVSADPDRLHRAGLSRRKVATLRAVAAHFADGSLSDASLRRLSDADIEARLTAIPGIGPWAVHGLLIIAFGRPDVVLPGDLALRKAIQHTYHLDHLPTQDEVLRIAEPWRPYRSLATAYLFQAGFDRSTPDPASTRPQPAPSSASRASPPEQSIGTSSGRWTRRPSDVGKGGSGPSPRRQGDRAQPPSLPSMLMPDDEGH
ncbi:MAG TPA: hypothetical protein VEH29_08155 [Acidimicrobiales bacterium]|nr:hypothetical protein [Acidimicrobiales bacterium]